MHAAAIVPAAGQGRRMREGARPRKQFRLLDGQPLLVWTLRVLAAHRWVRELVVAAPAGEAEELAAALSRLGLPASVQVVAGGATRQQSVGRALQAVSADADLVAVHDAVRPFLAPERLEAVLQAARRGGAAALAVPLEDTLRGVSESRFLESVDRTGLWRMQTPQVFFPEILRAAHRAAGGVEGTDDVELVRRMGSAVEVVRGSSINLKITTPSDWELAEMLWPTWQERVLHQE